MIRDARQLKAKIRHLTQGDSQKSQTYLRNFFMERFLERISVSAYQEKFVLKGGLLIASIVGLDMRSTMDIDSTVQSLSLDQENAVTVVQEIIEAPIDDRVNFILSNIRVLWKSMAMGACALHFKEPLMAFVKASELTCRPVMSLHQGRFLAVTG